jgi:hypothetical protein
LNSTPQLLGRDRRAVAQGAQLGPGDLRMDAAAETAVSGPVAGYGPFVRNTKAEIHQAFEKFPRWSVLDFGLGLVPRSDRFGDVFRWDSAGPTYRKEQEAVSDSVAIVGAKL